MTLWTENRAILLLAVQFLTRIPVRDPDLYSASRMAAVPRFFPLVGVLVGGLVAGVFWLAVQVFPPVVAVLVATAFSLRLTGAFHEDGFADACDGLGGGVARDKVLEIMRDSRLGTYGTAGLVLMVGTKVAALAHMPVVLVPVALIVGHALSRGSAVVALASGTYLRPDGTASPVQQGLDRAGWLWFAATVIAVLALALSMLPVAALALGLAGLALGHVLMRLSYEPRLRGYTGDCLGSVQQASEVGFLLGVLAWL